MREVAVSGIGLVTPLGATAAETFAAMKGGARPAKAPLPDLLNTPLSDAAAAVLPPFDPAERLGGRKMLKYMSAAAVLGCVAAREAVESSGIRFRCEPERIGLYAGTGLAAADISQVLRMVEQSVDSSGSFSTRLLGEKALPATNPLLSFHILANMPACLVSIMETIKGPNLVFTPWESQTGSALAEAHRAVASGEVDGAIAGAADTPAHPAVFLFLRQAGLISPGEFPASAAAYLVLEAADSMAKPLGFIKGISLHGSGGKARDPLAGRMGRTFAAAPALLAALACRGLAPELEIVSTDGRTVGIDAEAAK